MYAIALTVYMLRDCREASDIIKKGKMCSLFINDLDAGAGLVHSTLSTTRWSMPPS